ncbi:hypothetical protein C6P40_003854 [Pichia californica]|uniref:Transcription factor domain-containing protein n=1 Tax=Pichia californica TaxID=460514 RepID=A0A9P7BGI3_9ASCO|nr:hypothetical protein C6P40_003854 [[Candida] californica]
MTSQTEKQTITEDSKMVAVRSILKIIYAMEQAEGVGARVRRSIGTTGMRNFTPFLMLDHFNVAPDAGFPDHPHRGQETITLVMKNYMLHEDFTGKSGVLRPGDLQFMTAGKGIVHSEMPYSEDGTNVEGMQLWVDLPKDLKHTAPRYRDLRAEEIPIVRPNDKVEVKVISGKSYGVESVKDLAYTPMDYYWFTVQPGGNFEQPLRQDFNAFLYILNGSVEFDIGEKKELVKEHHTVFFKRDGEGIKGSVPIDGSKTDFVVIAGQALDQPIVQYGPFVETSKEDIYHAFNDYQSAKNGFENARGWASEIGVGVDENLFRVKSNSLLTQGLPLEAESKKIIAKDDESSLVQLKCLTKIVKAMFPECDPNKYEDIQNMAKVLYVKLPHYNITAGQLNESFTPVSNIETLISDHSILTPSPKPIDHETQMSRIASQIEILKNRSNSVFSEIDDHVKKEDGEILKVQHIKNEHENDGDEDDDYEDDDDDDDIHEEKYNDEVKEKEEYNNVNDEPSTAINRILSPDTTITNDSNKDLPRLRSLQIGLGGAERLFTVLLEVEKRHSHTEVPHLDDNNSLTSVTRQRNQFTFNPSYVIQGNDIQKFLLLDGIPRKECEFYTDVFFEKLHDRYFFFREDRFRCRIQKFLQILENKDENISKTDFTNEEICVIYLVWILGRKCYQLSMNNNSNDWIELAQVDNFVSDDVISDYLNAVNLCLSCSFFTKNINTVRLLYLSSLFHSSIKNRNAASHLIADSCIKCVSLGYHRSFPVSMLPEDQQEDIKIVWWACFKLHMNNCIIMGRLPNISLYEVDLEIPKLDFIKDELFKRAYKSGIELFKIMFGILKNREYLIRSKNPWCSQNFVDVIRIKNELLQWGRNIDPEIKNFKGPDAKRYIIKLHMQYYHCIMSLSVPYLIAYSLRPQKPHEANVEVIKTLCLGIKSSIDIVDVLRVSTKISDFNGLLFYDLFYAYNALMMLLLAYTLIKNGSKDKKVSNYNILSDLLYDVFKIDIPVIMKTIHYIKDINNEFGATSTGMIKDASNNITLLLKYFKIDNSDHIDTPESADPKSSSIMNHPLLPLPVYSNNQTPLIPSSDFYMGHQNQDIPPNSPFNDMLGVDNEFFEIIQTINTEVQQKPHVMSDKFFWDWSQLLSVDEYP